MSTVIKVENLSKEYQLGVIGHGTLYRDLQSYWARLRGKEDPNSKVHDKTRVHGDRFWALQDISFEIEAGDRVGIIGRNGAGKSTLLKILSRVTTPSKGNVKIKGRIASLLEVGTGFHPELTGRENIYLNGAILGMSKSEVKSKFDEIVDFSGVEDFIDTPVKRYSSGMYVRLAFAVAAHLDPEILIVDEVLAVGDMAFQKKCLGKMEDVSKNQGRTVLFVSHNIPAIVSLCNISILLSNGSLEDQGMTLPIVQKYRNSHKPDTYIMTSSLEDRLNRTSGDVQFTKFEILNSNGEICNELKKGDSVLFTFYFQIRKSVDSLGFLLYIKNAETHEIITSIKKIISCDKLSVGSQGKIILDFDSINIRAKEYSFYVALSSNDFIKYFDVIDENVNLPTLNIVSTTQDPHWDNGYFDINPKINIQIDK
jgi:lipopolysaccharide transport system ATP-binding protein